MKRSSSEVKPNRIEMLASCSKLQQFYCFYIYFQKIQYYAILTLDSAEQSEQRRTYRRHVDATVLDNKLTNTDPCVLFD